MVCFKGDPALPKTIVFLKSMLHSIKRGEQGFLVEFGTLTLQTMSEDEIDKEVETLMGKYAVVCEQLVGLPSQRT